MQEETKEIEVAGCSIVAHANGGLWLNVYRDRTGRTHGGRWITPHANVKSGYHYARLRKNSHFLWHRIMASAFLSDYSNDLDVDHIDGDKSNNAAANLRILTRRQNCMAYRKKPRAATSRFRGVSWCRASGSWRVTVTKMGARNHVGRFRSEIEAAVEFNRVAQSCGYCREALNIIP